jgi:hypothetical protein
VIDGSERWIGKVTNVFRWFEMEMEFDACIDQIWISEVVSIVSKHGHVRMVQRE